MKRFLGWAVLAALVVFSGCSEEDLGSEYPNELPETVLSNAPPQGSVGSFLVDMNWYGIDDDGEVVGYFFAWDDTASWAYTPSTESTFVVSADNCVNCDYTDTLYFDLHTFWIKAVDNVGAHDPTPAHRTFTAESTAPLTEITRGPCERNYCGVTGENILFEWTSFDPDGGEIDSFYYRLNVGGITNVVDDEWNRVGADCTYVRFANVENLYQETGHFNSFAVVAKDNAGSMERVLVHGQNWCCFDPQPGFEAEVRINGGILGRRDNSVPSGPQHVGQVSEIFVGVEVAFTWEADASHYGASIVGYRYAREDTTEWTAWYSGNISYPVGGEAFTPSVGNHVLYVQALDDLGTPSLCYFKYYVEAGPRVGETQPLLIVDDSQYSGLPVTVGDRWNRREADVVEGQFFERILEEYDYTEWDCIQQSFQAPPVSLVGRYRTVLWYVDDYDGTASRLWELFRRGTRYLDSYVKVGGNLIMVGPNPASHLDMDCRNNAVYPFKYDESYCSPGQSIPISYCAFGLSDLFVVGEQSFRGAIAKFPDKYPSLPFGHAWPYYGYPSPEDSSYLYAVETFSTPGLNANVNATPIYDFDYYIGAGLDSSIITGEHCALIVDNSDPAELTGSTAYFGWALIWSDWDSVAVFMRNFLSDVCDEPPTGP